MALDFVRLRATLCLEDMRAYVMQAFTPKEVEPIVEAALAEALLNLPAQIKREATAGINEAVTKSIKEAINPWRLQEELTKKLRPILLRAIADSYREAAEYYEREKN